MHRTPAADATPEDRVATSQTVTRVNRALAALDVDKRALFLLFEVEGESCAAIAETFAIPIGTVYSRLHAARSEFRRAYEALAKDDARAAHGGARRRTNQDQPNDV